MENKTKYIIDRFEGQFAICETSDLEYINISKELLPKRVKEGDVLLFDGEKYYIDIKENLKRKKEIEELTKDLWL